MTQTAITAPAAVPVPPLDGVAVTLGGRVYTLPPCNLATLRRHAKAIDQFSRLSAGDIFGEAEVDVVLNITFEALRRNYPDITPEFVAEHVAVDTMMFFFQAAMDASGLMRKAGQEDQAGAGAAAQGGGTLGESTGTASPPTS